MALGSTQPLIEMSTRDLPGGKRGRSVRLQPYRHRSADCLENVGASTSHNPMGLHGLLQDSFTFLFLSFFLLEGFRLLGKSWQESEKTI
jgi:hypothetical protein